MTTDQDVESVGAAAARNKSARAKARWGILRAALLGRDDGGNGAVSKYEDMARASIHRFEGFKLLDRRVVQFSDDDEDDDEDKISRELFHDDSDQNIQYECAEYSINLASSPNKPQSNDDTTIRVRTRERIPKLTQKVDLKALLSHRHHDGVDNTGQARVWDSESTLTYCLLSGGSMCQNEGGQVSGEAVYPLGIDNVFSLATTSRSDDNEEHSKKSLRVIELGAGMAGLAGLSLAALGMSTYQQHDVDIDVTLTDGHPDAVESNQICTILTSKLYGISEPQNISCLRLLWNDGHQGARDCNELTKDHKAPFQLCLASDCTHFQEFHAALVATIGRLLSVGGICLLCQPKRADSLGRFMALVDSMNEAGVIFELKLYERYNYKLWKMHQEYVAKEKKSGEDESASGSSNVYDPSLHYPLLLVLKKLGQYREEVHTAAAVKHMKERDEE